MRETDGMSFRQYAAAVGTAMFSPVTRLLPGAVLRAAGFSGWLAPLVALPLLAVPVLAAERLAKKGEERVGLGEALELRLGALPGRLTAALICAWMAFYGGVVLRTGGERILSAIYPAGNLSFFMGAMAALGAVFAWGKLRWAGRSARVTFLAFLLLLGLVFAMALPGVKGDYIWPPDLSRPGRLGLAALPVAEVLSPWVFFSFLRGDVEEDGGALRRGLRGMGLLAALTLLFLLTTVGQLGPELSLRQQYPFYVLVKNLRLFDLMERFDGVIVVIWVMTDYVFLGMLLLSAAEALRRITRGSRRQPWVLLGAAAMFALGHLSGRGGVALSDLSEKLVPAVNAAFAFLLLPLLSLLPVRKQKT